MAGRVCYKHCNSELMKENNDITIVTASCDHIEFYPVELSLANDAVLEVKYFNNLLESSLEENFLY